MVRPLVRLIRLASLAICVIVLASFAIFVVNQSKSASAHQTQEIVHGSSTPSAPSAHESGLHKTLEEASEKLTSPFAGVISSSSSEWVVRGVKLLLALAIYGFGVGYLSRAVLVRV
ncbi:MAG TPA: hypothetical protein VGY13_06330 [Solirubrobacteraceae bacterium]|jgi:hypothetical protein|nr:hypothetical protein [Solirubrobacteraceae bacterium]